MAVTGGCANGCQNPCNCTFFDDGVVQLGSGDYVLNSGKGRRNTVVSGKGTIKDPITVSFIDSEFFRPEAGEYTFPDQEADLEDTYVNFFPATGVVVYQTPGKVFGSLDETFTPFNFSRTVKGFYQIFGASATFSADSTGARRIAILNNDTSQNILAASTVDAGSESQTISCTGFHPGVFAHFGALKPGYPFYMVRVYQNTGGTLQLTNLKFWVGSL